METKLEITPRQLQYNCMSLSIKLGNMAGMTARISELPGDSQKTHLAKIHIGFRDSRIYPIVSNDAERREIRRKVIQYLLDRDDIDSTKKLRISERIAICNILGVRAARDALRKIAGTWNEHD